MPTARQLIERDVARAALAAPEWAEEVLHHHFQADGAADPPVLRTCFVFREREEGTNEDQISGAGRELDDLEGRRIRSSYSLLLSNDVEIGTKDYFVIDGMQWFYERPLDRDSDPQGTKRILVVHVQGDFTRAPRLRGVGANSRRGAMG